MSTRGSQPIACVVLAKEGICCYNIYMKVLKVAKIFGYLFIILGGLGVFGGLGSLSLGLSAETLSTNPLVILIQGIVTLVIGIGLIKTKLWSVYGFVFLIIFNLILQIVSGNTALLSFNPVAIIGILIQLSLAYWFYSNKNNFLK